MKRSLAKNAIDEECKTQKQSDNSLGYKPRKSTEHLDERDRPQQTHPQTFKCLSSCTEWFLIVQIDNSQIKIPAKQQAVRYSENNHDLPILTKDLDLLMNLVKLEEQLSTSRTPVTELNRPVPGLNPNSRKNTSKNGFLKKAHVLKEERKYLEKLQLHLVDDSNYKRQDEISLSLPIRNTE